MIGILSPRRTISPCCASRNLWLWTQGLRGSRASVHGRSSLLVWRSSFLLRMMTLDSTETQTDLKRRKDWPIMTWFLFGVWLGALIFPLRNNPCPLLRAHYQTSLCPIAGPPYLWLLHQKGLSLVQWPCCSLWSWWDPLWGLVYTSFSFISVLFYSPSLQQKESLRFCFR